MRYCDTKIKLLHTALRLISESNYKSVSVDEICNQAGVNKGSFYFAYKSKSDLAVAVFERNWELKRAKLEECFDKNIPALERLERYCELVRHDQLEKYRTSGKILGCPFCSIGSELSTQDENIRQKAEEIGGRYLTYLSEVLSELVANKTVHPADPNELATEVYSYIIGVILQAKIENSPSHLDLLKPGLWRLLAVNDIDLSRGFFEYKTDLN